jgi:PR domain zinc finger protein 1
MILGEKPHKCDVCQKRFSSTSNLKTHLRLHNGQRPYSCELCSQRFTQLVHLKLHKRLHTNERPFTCSQCGKTYISPSGLRTHWKNTTCKPIAGEIAVLEAYTEINGNNTSSSESVSPNGGEEINLSQIRNLDHNVIVDEHCVTSTTPVDIHT